MTDEQIKQNAEEYASTKEMHSPRSQDVELDKLMIIEDYIAGAHSRDEEIESLQEVNSHMESLLRMHREMKGEYELKLQKLRNPWISVDERMPEKCNKNKNYSVNCIVRYTDEYLFPRQVFYTEAYYDYGYEKKSPYYKGRWMATYNDDEHFFFSDYEEYGCVVTHWMPIQKLKKGD